MSVINKKNIFSKSNSEHTQSIFKDETVFYADYFPENIVSRDKEINEITYLLKPLTNNKRASNILISGDPGTGKTLICNYILQQLTDYTTKVKYQYINCIKNNTKSSVLSKIIEFFGAIMPRRGLASDEIWSRIQELYIKSNFSPIIVLDEIDKMNTKESSELLYDLARFNHNSKYFTIILITNFKSFIFDLDNRTQSTLFLSDVDFKKYTSPQLKEILLERVEYGLIPKAISNDLIGYIAGYGAVRGGDARVSIDLLYKSAKESEKIGSLKITKDILLSSAKLVDSIKLSEKIKTLSKAELGILEIISEKTTTNDLYNKSKLSERTIRRYLEKLEKLKLITTRNADKGKKRIVNLNFEKELLDFLK